jgi:selenide,water dikinase
VLRQLPSIPDPNLLSGFASNADAAVYRLSAHLAIVHTVDFITPIVDDPFAFGAIAAANALSDIYAMGGRPVLALNLVGYPIKTMPIGVLHEILRGGATKLAEAGAKLAGGHSIEDLEPKYGLAVAGLVDPRRMVTNQGAQPGDVLVLTKPLGTGIITTGIDQELTGDATVERVIALMTQLNRAASEVMVTVGVHAATDVTGFGLLGHLHELAEASGVGARIYLDRIPLLDETWELAEQGSIPGGTRNNYHYAMEFTSWGDDIPTVAQIILCDAQTSGGLLIAVPADRTGRLLHALQVAGVSQAGAVGEIVAAPSGDIVVCRN